MRMLGTFRALVSTGATSAVAPVLFEGNMAIKNFLVEFQKFPLVKIFFAPVLSKS